VLLIAVPLLCSSVVTFLFFDFRPKHQKGKSTLLDEYAAVIYAPDASRLVRQHRLDGGAFIIAKFVKHGWRLRLGA
jgi:hypothetical protein